jgi:hypothetical protein
MPKCPAYETLYCKSDGQPCTHVVDCHNGYLKFWTEAERKGIKAMGFWVKVNHRRYQETREYTRFDRYLTWIMAIKNYVSAAIKAKGCSEKVNKAHP